MWYGMSWLRMFETWNSWCDETRETREPQEKNLIYDDYTNHIFEDTTSLVPRFKLRTVAIVVDAQGRIFYPFI